MIHILGEGLALFVAVTVLMLRPKESRNQVISFGALLIFALGLLIYIPAMWIAVSHETARSLLDYLLACVISITILRLRPAASKVAAVWLLLAGLVLTLIFQIQALPQPILPGIFQLLPFAAGLLAGMGKARKQNSKRPLILLATLALLAVVSSFAEFLHILGPDGILVIAMGGLLLQFMVGQNRFILDAASVQRSLAERMGLYKDYMLNINRIMTNPRDAEILYQDMVGSFMALKACNGAALFLLSKNQDRHFVLKAWRGAIRLPPAVFRLSPDQSEFIDLKDLLEQETEIALQHEAALRIMEQGMEYAGVDDPVARTSFKVLPLIQGHRFFGFFLLEFSVGQSYVRGRDQLLDDYLSSSAMAVESIEAFANSTLKVSSDAELQLSRYVHELCMRQVPELIKHARAELSMHHQSEATSHSDYMDGLVRKNGHICCIISDTAGTGLESALVTFLIRTLFQLLASADRSPAEILAWMNKALWRKLRLERFANTLIVCWNPEEKILTYSAAGSVNAFVVSASAGPGKILPGEQTILGLDPEAQFENWDLRLDTGDILVCYTDGLVETRNDEGLLYGVGTLMNLTQQNRNLASKSISQVVMSDLKRFAGTENTVQQDEKSLMLLKIQS